MTDALEAMREKVQARKDETISRRKKVWTPPDPARFRLGGVLAFDQTLTNTGYALVYSDHAGLMVVGAGVLEARTSLTGFEETYAKAERLERGISEAVRYGALASVSAIVHEMPSVQGYRTESSLLAGYLVRRAARDYARGIPVVAVSNLAMKALLLPPGQRDEKKYVRQAVESLIPKERREKPMVQRWNEHVHDAVGLALTFLYEGEG